MLRNSQNSTEGKRKSSPVDEYNRISHIWQDENPGLLVRFGFNLSPFELAFEVWVKVRS